MKVSRCLCAMLALFTAVLPQPGAAVGLSASGIGDAAVMPYYSTREGWQTMFTLTNSGDDPIAVKVRLREALNNRAVLGFVVALAAHDEFAGVIRESATGPVFVNVDQANDGGLYSCTVPLTRAADGSPLEIPLGIDGFSGLDVAGDSNGDNGPENIDRVREGYVEFIVMGYADSENGIRSASSGQIVEAPIDAEDYAALDAASKRNFVGYAIEHQDCATVRAAFTAGAILNTARQFGEPVNVMRVSASMLSPVRGTEAEQPITTWANFYSPHNGSDAAAKPPHLVQPRDNWNCDVDRGAERRTGRTGNGAGTNWCADGGRGNNCSQPPVNAAASVAATTDSCRNLIAAQVAEVSLEPSLNDVFPVRARISDENNAMQVTVEPIAETGLLAAIEAHRGIDALSATIQRARIRNEWSTNPNLGVSTDWIVTMPTKGFYVDQGENAQSAVIVDDVDAPSVGVKGRAEAFLPEGRFGTAGAPYAPFAQRFQGVAPNAKACAAVALDVYDRAAQGNYTDPDDPVLGWPSPDPSVRNQICHASTVMSFVDSSGLLRTALGSGVNHMTVDVVNILATPQDFGWLSISTDESSNGAVLPASRSYRGLPVIGFGLRTRSFPNRPDLSFASSSAHSYEIIEDGAEAGGD